MMGITQVIAAGEGRKARFLTLMPQGLMILPTAYKPSDALMALVGDDADPDGASLGPAGFNESVLRQLLMGAQTIICSAIMEDKAGFAASQIYRSSPTGRMVIVMTQPRHHAAWAMKVEEMSGAAPALHVVVDEADLPGRGVPGSSGYGNTSGRVH
jgi:hypothetical protein